MRPGAWLHPIAMAVALAVDLSTASAQAAALRLAQQGIDFTKPHLIPDKNPPITDKTPPSVEPCQAQVTTKGGVVTLDFVDASRSNQRNKITLDGLVYGAAFDAGGRLHFDGPLFHPQGELQWSGRGGADCRRPGLAFENYGVAFETALVWGGPFDLRLNVQEPGGRIGGLNRFVYPGRPNLDLQTGLGYVRTFGLPDDNSTHVWLYTLPADRDPGSDAGFNFGVEFASRGNPARAPFCGAGPLATVKYRLFQLEGGVRKSKEKGFDAAACGSQWGDKETEWQWDEW